MSIQLFEQLKFYLWTIRGSGWIFHKSSMPKENFRPRRGERMWDGWTYKLKSFYILYRIKVWQLEGEIDIKNIGKDRL